MKPDKKRTHYGISDTTDSDVLRLLQLPESCQKTVCRHVNTIHVGTILRIYNQSYGPEGQLATAHWSSNNEIYVTLHDDQICINIIVWKSLVISSFGKGKFNTNNS